jgi:hypothetical protein
MIITYLEVFRNMATLFCVQDECSTFYVFAILLVGMFLGLCICLQFMDWKEQVQGF